MELWGNITCNSRKFSAFFYLIQNRFFYFSLFSLRESKMSRVNDVGVLRVCFYPICTFRNFQLNLFPTFSAIFSMARANFVSNSFLGLPSNPSRLWSKGRGDLCSFCGRLPATMARKGNFYMDHKLLADNPKLGIRWREVECWIWVWKENFIFWGL